MLETKPSRDLRSVRQDFPIFALSGGGPSLVYLDSAATSQRPESVLAAMDDFYRHHNANVHRGVYALSEEATALYEGARLKIARFLGARSPREIVFVRNATEAINLVAYAWGRKYVREGDLIVSTVLEHHSNLVPWQVLAAERGAELAVVGADAQGRLLQDELYALLARRPKLVAFTHMSNALGTINPVAEMTEAAHRAGALVLVDGAQSAPHRQVDVQAIGADFFVLSGHKMLGPTGIGVLHGRREVLEAMPPFLAGGDMIRNVDLTSATWNDLPWKFEAGTPAIAEAIGLGAAVDYLQSIGMAAVERHEAELVAHALERLARVQGVRLFGPAAAQRGGVVSFDLTGIHPHDLASLLDREGVAVRAGHHCCQPLMAHLGVPATTRASFYLYNTPGDVDRLVDAIQAAKRVFGA